MQVDSDAIKQVGARRFLITGRSMIQHQGLIIGLLFGVLCLTACDETPQPPEVKTPETPSYLTSLDINVKPANYAVPFCENRDCLDIDIKSISTQYDVINQWIERVQSRVIQEQIGLKQNLTLQEAINAYVKKSDEWQRAEKGNKSFSLTMTTRIASQRQQYVLLQLILEGRQNNVRYNKKSYFFVYDRRQNKSLSILEILKPDHQHRLHSIIQEAYQTWLEQQSDEVKEKAPEQLYWGQADWFFDPEGIGFHYRQGQITENAPVLDIYLTPEQGKAMVQEQIYQVLFPVS